MRLSTGSSESWKREDAFADYEEGMKLVKSCNEKIETIEKKILVLSGDQTEEKENGGQF